LDVAQDLALLLDVTFGGGDLIVDREVAFLYRRHRQSDSSVRALSGGRFQEERKLFTSISGRCREVGWRRAAFAAKTRLASRLHAMSLVPMLLRKRQFSATISLVRHALSS
jgi:hypothetical protein